MKKGFFIFLLIIQNAFAQTNPLVSLEKQLDNAKNDPDRLTILTDLINIAFATDLNKALLFTDKAVKIAERSGDQKTKSKFYEMKGRIFANMVQLDSAVIFFDKAMAGYKAINDKKGQATTWFKIGWVYKKKQQIDKAMEADMTALNLMESLNDQQGIAGAMERLSDDLTQQGRLKEALEYAEKSIGICEKNEFKEQLMFAFFNAGNVAIAMEKYPESLAYYDKAIEINRSMKLSEMNLSDFSNARGNALKRLGRLPEALDAYTKAMNLAQKTNYNNAINAVTANLGEVNMLMGNYAVALKYQLKTIELQESAGEKTNLIENYVHISTIYEKLGDYSSALSYQKKALSLRDSTASKESDVAMSELLTKYETEKKQATILSQQQQLSQQRREQWLSIGAVSLLAILLIVGYRSYSSRTKANKLLAAKNKENELLLREIHHRVKNNLEVVSSLLALQSAQIDDPNTKDAMLEGQNRVLSIGIVHQKLYQGENLGAIEMKDYFINLSDSILDSFGAHKKVQVECAMDTLNIDIDTAVPLGLIVNELLTNTLKYAFPADRNGKVQIKLEKRLNGILQLQVSDDGVGKSGETKGTGFGGQLVNLLTKQLNGTMREEINNGTTIFFEFKTGKAA